MCHTKYSCEAGLCEIHIDEDGQDIRVTINGEVRGTITLNMYQEPYHFRIVNLSLDNIRRMGIGRRCLQLHKEHFDAPITAASPYEQNKLNDGSHLTGDGVPFIQKMREEGIVAKLPSDFDGS